jgi:hypothetical protein
MRGVIAVYRHRFDAARQHFEWSLERARRIGDARAELVAQSGNNFLALATGRARDVVAQADTVLELAERVGARRFQASLTVTVCLARATLGEEQGAYERLCALREAVRGNVENFWLPQCLGALALSAPTEAERRAFAEAGLRALNARSPVHARAGFYLPALEALLRDESFELALQCADSYATFVAQHPFAEAEFVIDRARALAMRGMNGTTPEVRVALSDLKRRAALAGLADPLLVLPV